MDSVKAVRAARVCWPCASLNETLAFFTDRLGFRLDTIYPADCPSVAVVSGFGLCVQLEEGGEGAPGVLRLLCDGLDVETTLEVPGGGRVELVAADPPLVWSPPRSTRVVCPRGESPGWVMGRAGMRYRDLIPERLGGFIIASHIRIDEGGPVPDYVHHHKVHFQMIYCVAGWVRVVYEDQGPPLVMRPGDCVLQPPGIRHRVLSSSSGLEVVEVGCPALHETHVDHDMTLPTETFDPERRFEGQRFVVHEAEGAVWVPDGGFEARDTGITAATEGLAGVRVVRGRGSEVGWWGVEGALTFVYVLEGTAELLEEGQGPRSLAMGDAAVMPSASRWGIASGDEGVVWLEVVLARQE